MTPTEYGALCALHAQGVIDGKPTTEQLFIDAGWMSFNNAQPLSFEYANLRQWRAIDPLSIYKEAFAEGKQVEYYHSEDDVWLKCFDNCLWLTKFKYRIVEPKTVKLYPFTIRYIKTQHFSNLYYFESMESAKAEFGDACEIMQINPNGSIEVQS